MTALRGTGMVRTGISARDRRISGTVPLGYADMFVAVNDERRRGWFLSYSVGLWRGRIGTVALPFVDFLQRSSHERCLVVLGQAFGVAERRDALLTGQHARRPRPVGVPHMQRSSPNASMTRRTGSQIS